MENNKIKTRKKITPNFGKDKKLAMQVLEDEQKAKEAFRKKHHKEAA